MHSPIKVSVLAASSSLKVKETKLYYARDFGYGSICPCDPIAKVARLYAEISIVERGDEPRRLSGQIGIRIRTDDRQYDLKSELECEADAQGLICGFRDGCPADRFYVVGAKIDILDSPAREDIIIGTVRKLNAFAAKVYAAKEQHLPSGLSVAPQIELVEAISARPLEEARAR